MQNIKTNKIRGKVALAAALFMGSFAVTGVTADAYLGEEVSLPELHGCTSGSASLTSMSDGVARGEITLTNSCANRKYYVQIKLAMTAVDWAAWQKVGADVRGRGTRTVNWTDDYSGPYNGVKFRVCQEKVGTDPCRETSTIKRDVEPGVKNQAPVAQANSMGFTFRPADPIGAQKCNSIDVLGNDTDPDGDALTAVATGANFSNNAPAGTFFTLDPNGTFSICVTRGAANNFSPANPLAVSYVAVDSKGTQSQPVNVLIAPSLVNAAPTAGSNSMGFTFRPADPIATQKCNSINVLTNDGDPDGDPLTAVPTGANFNNNAPNGTYYVLQPNGTFSICVTRGAANGFNAGNPLLVTYVAVDNQGAQSQPVNIFITPSLV